MTVKELCNYFESTGKDWSKERTETLIEFGIRLKDFLTHFNFASVDGLDNLTSNLHTILNEVRAELLKRKLRLP